MVNKKFEVYKIQREIKRSGILVQVMRKTKNQFNEPTGEPIKVGELKGLYHEQNGSIKITTGETTQVRTKKIPSLLCSYLDTSKLDLKVEDIIIIDNKKFKLVGLVDLQEWHLISDLSMELSDDGTI